MRTLGRLTPSSNLTKSGSVKMDSGLMGGTSLLFGSVGAISGVKNPILLAQKLVEEQGKGLASASGNTKRKRVANKMSDNGGCLNNFENCKGMNHESDYLNVNDQVGSNEEATMCKLLDGNTTLGCGDGIHESRY